MKFIVVLSLVGVGCSPYSVVKHDAPLVHAFGPARMDVATVCVIRSARWAQAVTFVIHDNDIVVGATRGRSHFCYEAGVGEHTIVSSTHDATDSPARLDVTLQAKRYWLLQDDRNSLGSLTSLLLPIDEAQAGKEINGTAYSQLTEVRSGEQVPAPMPYAAARPSVGPRQPLSPSTPLPTPAVIPG